MKLEEWTLEMQDKLVDYIKEQLFISARPDRTKKELLNGDNPRFKNLMDFAKKDRRRIINLAFNEAKSDFKNELELSPEVLVGKIMDIAENAKTFINKDGNLEPDYRVSLAAYDKVSKIMGYDQPTKQEITVKNIEINLE